MFTFAQRRYMLTHLQCLIYALVNRVSTGSDNGLSPFQCQAIFWTNAGLLSIGLIGTNFSEIVIKIQNFSFTKMHLKISSVKWQPLCPGENVLISYQDNFISFPYGIMAHWDSDLHRILSVLCEGLLSCDMLGLFKVIDYLLLQFPYPVTDYQHLPGTTATWPGYTISVDFRDWLLSGFWRLLPHITGLILGLHPANERRCCFVTTSLIGWAQT